MEGDKCVEFFLFSLLVSFSFSRARVLVREYVLPVEELPFGVE